MSRYVNLEEISDGRRYGPNDMVKADCHGCQGCSACCQGMGNSITLDPYDVYRLTTGLGKSLEQLLEREVELNVAEGIILPNLKMQGTQERCAFLDAAGYCSIHPLRPGICRLFPLGRVYEEGTFRFFLQTGECRANRTKVKVSKWVDTPELPKNMEFTNRWHDLLREARALMEGHGAEGIPGQEPPREDFAKSLNLLLLRLFFFAPYDGERDFYEQFEARCREYRERMPSAMRALI